MYVTPKPFSLKDDLLQKGGDWLLVAYLMLYIFRETLAHTASLILTYYTKFLIVN
jgi:hypothetical protein